MQIQQQQSIEGPLIFASASLQFPDVLKAVRSTIRDEVRWQVRERNVCHLLIVKLIRFLLALVSASPHATPLAMKVSQSCFPQSDHLALNSDSFAVNRFECSSRHSCLTRLTVYFKHVRFTN